MHFLIKCIVVALDEVEVHIHVLSDRTQRAAIQIQNGRFNLVRLGIKQNRVLMSFLGTHPWHTDTF